MNELLELVRSHRPAVVALARVVCLASRIDMPLLRAARLHQVAGASVRDEVEFWFGPLVGVRETQCVFLDTHVRQELRQELREAGPTAMARARELTEARRRAIPFLAGLEEDLVWWWLSEEVAELDAKLHSVTRAIFEAEPDEQVHLGLARWAIAFLRREPVIAHRTAAKWLRLVASVRLERDGVHPDDLAAEDLDEAYRTFLIGNIPTVAVGVRASGSTIEVREPPVGGAEQIAIPATTPRSLDVMWDGLHRQRLRWDRGTGATVSGAQFPFTLASVDGAQWRVHSGAAIRARLDALVAPFRVVVLDDEGLPAGAAWLTHFGLIATGERALVRSRRSAHPEMPLRRVTLSFPGLDWSSFIEAEVVEKEPGPPHAAMSDAARGEGVVLLSPLDPLPAGARPPKTIPDWPRDRTLYSFSAPTGGSGWGRFRPAEGHRAGFTLLDPAMSGGGDFSSWSGSPLIDLDDAAVVGMFRVHGLGINSVPTIISLAELGSLAERRRALRTEGAIYLCFRVEDSARETARLAEGLGRAFGEAEVFRDRERVQGGERWPERLREALATSRVVLAVVGKGWATAQFQDEERAGLLRLTDAEDWVRVEILAALAAGKVLIPVLCDGVELKSRKWLANFGLEALADQQAMRLRVEDWESDLRAIVARIRAVCPDLRAAPPLPAAGSATTSATMDWTPYLDYLVETHTWLDRFVRNGRQVGLPMDQAFFRLRVTSHGMDLHHRRPETLDEALKHRVLVLVGGPGAGKTTTLRHVALLLARGDAAKLGFDPARAPVPVFLKLPEVAEKAAAGKWPEILTAELEKRGCEASGKDLLRTGHLILLLDSLDEVAGEDRRRKIAKEIASLAAAHGKRHRLVVGCRIKAWGSGEGYNQFEEAEIQPLDLAEMARFVRQYCEVACPSAAVAVERAADILSALREQPPLRELAAAPQTLTMLCHLYLRDGRLPQQRAELYEACVETHVTARPDLLANWGGPRAARRDLTLLAATVQVKEPELASVAAAEKLLAERLRARDVKRADEPGEYLNTLALATGLISVDGPNVKFANRTFQEYLTAYAFAEGDPVRSLEDRFQEPRWREVYGLTMGVLARRGAVDTIAHVLRALIGPAPKGEKDRPQWAGAVGAAAACLPDLEGVSLEKSAVKPLTDALDQVLPLIEDNAQRTPVNVRVAIADALGRTWDPRLRDEMRWVDIPAGTFQRGADPNDKEHDPDAFPSSQVTTSRFLIQRWPVTIDEYRQFMEVGGAYETREHFDEEGRQWLEAEGVTEPRGWATQLQRAGNHPVTGVSWHEASAFCCWLRQTARGVPWAWEVRLPTEAEWERAARGDTDARLFPWGADRDSSKANWYLGDHSLGDTSPVGVFPAGHSPHGLWDVVGNVWEWCLDTFDARAYERKRKNDPIVHDENSEDRVARGGAWSTDGPRTLRVSYRGRFRPADRHGGLGFRCVAAPRVPGP